MELIIAKRERDVKDYMSFAFNDLHKRPLFLFSLREDSSTLTLCNSYTDTGCFV